MGNQQLEVIFRGDIAPGENLSEVRERLRELFKADDQQLARLFSGRPTVIRRNLDQAAAERYRDAIAKAGALVEIRATVPEVAAAGSLAERQGQPYAEGPTEASTSAINEPEDQSLEAPDWQLAPVGADVLTEEEKAPAVETDVDTSRLDLSPEGSDVLTPQERQPVVERDIDTSDISLQ